MLNNDDIKTKFLVNKQKITQELQKFLDDTYITEINNNLKKLSFSQIDSSLNNSYFLNSLAFYSNIDNTIYYKDTNSILQSHNLLHEMVHSIPKDKNNFIGLVANKTLYDNNNKLYVNFCNGVGLNEGYIEYLATKINGDNNPNCYLYLTNIVDTLNKYSNIKENIKCFVESDLVDFINKIKSSFKLPDSKLIHKLILLTDKLFYNYMYNTNKKANEDMFYTALECYKTLLDMIIIYNKNSNITMPIFNWNACFGDFGFPLISSSSNYQYLVNYLSEYYFAKITQKKTNSFVSDNIYYMQCIATLIITANSKDKPLSQLPQYQFLKTSEFYHLLFSFNVADEKISNNITIADNYKTISKLVKIMFQNPSIFKNSMDNEYQTLVKFVLTHPVCTKASAYKDIPNSYLVKYLSKNTNYYLTLTEYNFLYFARYLDNIELTKNQYVKFQQILQSKKNQLSTYEFNYFENKINDKLKNLSIETNTIKNNVNLDK